MNELRGLTGARGLAAWMVVLFHLRAWMPIAAPVRDVLGKGNLAVDFFFLLSGFVIWLSYAGRLRTGGWGAVPDFLRRRVARIWPLHLVMLGYALLLVIALAVTGRPADPRFPLDALPIHALLLQSWVGDSVLDWNDPAWSISAEMFAYLMFVPLALWIDWRRVPAIGLVLAAAMLLLAMAAIMDWRGEETLGQDVPRFALVRCAFEFAAGTALGALWLRCRGAPRLPAMGAFLTAAIAVALGVSGVISELIAAPFALAALLTAIALYANSPRNPLAARPIHYLGEISFATYLVHSLLWKTMSLAFVHGRGPVGWGIVIAYIALVFATSVFLYHAVERPAQRWINRMRWPGAFARTVRPT